VVELPLPLRPVSPDSGIEPLSSGLASTSSGFAGGASAPRIRAAERRLAADPKAGISCALSRLSLPPRIPSGSSSSTSRGSAATARGDAARFAARFADCCFIADFQ
jgi:hypothetical protein